MKKLFFSLLFVVITAVAGLGWLVSQIYYKMDETKLFPQQNEITAYKHIGKNLAISLDEDPELKQAILEAWPQTDNLQVNIMEIDSFPLPPSLKKDFQDSKPLLLEDDDNLSLHFNLPNTQQVLTLSLPKNKVMRKKNSVTGLLLTLLFYCGIILIIIAWLSPLLRQLISLQKSAINFGNGKLDTRITFSQFSYISQIEEAFNNMADRIERLIADNKLLSRAVSHDLKTPFARLRFGIDTFAETEDRQKREKYHKRITRDLNEMESLINTLLQYAKLDENNICLNNQPLNLNTLARQLCMENKNEEKLIIIKACTKELTINADRVYLTMLINNILRNAIQYSFSQVIIKTEIVRGKTLLSIADDGPGIPKNEQAKLFMPFIRGDNNSSTKGHGMGLAIASKIAEWHGISINAGISENLKGLEIQLVFPKCN